MQENNFINPQKILAQIELEPGTVAADFGCGSGYFSVPLSKAVGEGGKVYCLDVLPSALETVESKKNSESLNNLFTKRANFEKDGGSGFEDKSLDLAVVKDVLFQNKDHGTIIKEAFRTLKENGKLLLIEWEKGKPGIGPSDNLRLDKKETLELCQQTGFKFIKEIEAGDFHFAFLFKK